MCIEMEAVSTILVDLNDTKHMENEMAMGDGLEVPGDPYPEQPSSAGCLYLL